MKNARVLSIKNNVATPRVFAEETVSCHCRFALISQSIFAKTKILWLSRLVPTSTNTCISSLKNIALCYKKYRMREALLPSIKLFRKHVVFDKKTTARNKQSLDLSRWPLRLGYCNSVRGFCM